MKITIEIEVPAPSLSADNIGLVAEHAGRSIQAHGYQEGEGDYATLPDNTQARYAVWCEPHHRTEPKEIRVESRSVYGEWKVYPACADARRFADLAGTKTLSHGVLCLIEALGYTITAVSPVITRAR